MTQFHSDIDRIGQHSDSLAMANAPGDLGRSGARADGDDIAVVDEAGGFEADLTFFSFAFFLLLLEGGDVAEGFVEHGSDRDSAAMIPAQQPLALEIAEITADRHCRYAKPPGKTVDGNLAVAEQFFEYGLPAASRSGTLVTHDCFPPLQIRF